VTIASGGTVTAPAQLTLTATVLAGATPVTKGTVNFCNSTAAVCSDINLIGTAQITAAGTASFTFVPAITPPNTATPPVTTPHSYKAVFLPTVADAGSSSAASTLFVNGTNPTTSVLTEVQTSVNPAPYVYTLTDTVTGNTQAYPTGTVTFYDTSDVLTPASAGPPPVPAVYLDLGTAPIVAGSSSFVLKPQTPVTTSNLPRYEAVGDLNGDGIPDIAVSDFGINPTTNTSTVDIFFGKGDGTFTAGPLLHVSAGDGPQFTLLADFNNDGCLDVVTESYSANTLYLFLNTKTNGVCTGTFGAALPFTNAAIFGPGGIGVGDFNGDGNLDIVVANNSSASTNPSTGATSNIFYGNGAGGFTLGGNLTPGGTINPQFSAIADYNGDGFLDIAVANNATNTINIYLNSATTPGTFTLHTTLNTPGGNIIILPADVNKDGKVDLVVSSGSTATPINVWIGDGTGAFTAAANPPTGTAFFSSIAVADFNGDGNVDIATTTSSPTAPGVVSTLLGNGNGTFQAPSASQPTQGNDTLTLAVGDFNGDGYSDITVANFSSNNLIDYLAGYQTVGTATANLPGVTLYGATVNPHLADAVFPTDSVYTTSTSNTVPLQANILPATAPDETLTMTATPVTTDFGQQVALQAKFVYINLGPSYQPNGETVTFYQVATNGNLTSLGTATWGTVASPGCSTVTAGTPSVTTTTCTSTVLNTTTLPLGTDTLEASYNLTAPPALPMVPATNGADASFTGLISPTVKVTVSQVPGTSDTVTAAPNPTAYGQPTTLTFCIPVGTGANLGANVPSGTVQFSYGTPATNINAPVTIGTTPTNETVNGVTTSCYVAQTTTTALPTGNDTVTGTFTPGANSGYGPGAPTTAVTVAKAPITNPTDPLLSQSFTAVPGTQVFGSPVVLTYTIPVAAGNAPPVGPVAFTDGTLALGSCGSAGSPPAFSAGTTFVFAGVTYTNYSCSTTTSALPVGNPDTVTATYTATDPNYAGGPTGALTAPVIVTAGTAAATLSAGPNPATFGTTVTITETLAPINGVCPTAPVSFYSGGTVTGGVNTGGTLIPTTAGTVNPATVVATPATGTATSCTASIQTNSLPVGTTTVTATAPANGSFAAVSSGPLPVVINQDAAADTLATTPNPSTFGQPVTITDTIPNAPNGTVPTGTVQFYDYTTPIGTPQPVTNGVATLITSTLPVGTDSITGVYSGDTNFASVTSNAVNQVVNAVATTPTLSAAPNPTTFGTQVTIQETIPVVNGTAPTGPVTFYYELPGSTTQIPIGTFNLTATNGGVATATTTTLPVGVDNLYASYAGNTNYAAVTSGPDAETVNKAIGPDTLAVAPNPQVFGSTVVATDTIPTVGGVAPTGTVTFYDNGPTGTNLGTFPVVNGVATLSTTTLPVGTQPITAVYSGDSNYGVITSNQVNEVITVGSTVPALSANPNPTTFGTQVTLTEQIPGINGVTPTGTVTFTYVAPGSTTVVTIATNVVVKNGVATATISTLPIGVDAVTAVYSGDTNYATATNKTNVTVGLAAGADTIVGAPNPANSGTAVTFTYTVPVVNGVTPTGTVTFYNGTTAFTGTTTPFNAAGQTTITTSALPVGVLTITGKYPGDNTYAAGTASTTETINAIIGGDTVTAAPNPTTYGAPDVLTFCIPVVAGAGTPTGTVTFSTGGTTINTAVTIGTVPTTVNGTSCYVATTTTSNLPVGSPTVVTGTYAPAAGSPYAAAAPTANVTVAPAPESNDSIKATPNPQTVALPVTLTFSIPGAVGNAAPTGSVTFTSGGVTQGTAAVTFTPGATVNGITTYTATTTTTTLPVGTDTVTGTYTGDTNYAGGPLSTQETINAITGGDTVTVSPNPTVFGNPVTITFCIPVVAGTGSPTGTVTFSVGGTTINTPVTIGTTPVNGCYVATTTTSGLPVGAPTTVTGTYAPGPTSPYGPGAPTGTVTVGPVNPISVITYGPTSPTCSVTLVTLTDTITPVNGVVPTGTVQFYATVNGVVTPIGTPQTVVPPGVATLTIALPCGTTGIYAIYTGNTPYGTSKTPTVPLSLADFTIAAVPPTQTVNPGDAAVYTVSLAGAGGVAFNSPVTLTATGLPPGATVTFGTPTLVPGIGPTPTTMTIVTSPTVALNRPSHGNGIYYGLLLLPLLGIRRIRRKIRALPRGITYCLAALLLLGGLGAVTGCSGGYFGGGPNAFTITVTGTSGTVTHSTTVTLTVE